MDEIVWDRVVRLFHWLTAALFLLSYFVLEGGELWHRVAGYTIGGLLFVRTVWGFVGSPTARFVSFFPTPKRLLGYLRNFPHGQGSTLGHNPLGGLMVLWMLLLLSALVLTGWMQGLDRYWGEEWLDGYTRACCDDNALVGCYSRVCRGGNAKAYRQRFGKSHDYRASPIT